VRAPAGAVAVAVAAGGAGLASGDCVGNVLSQKTAADVTTLYLISFSCRYAPLYRDNGLGLTTWSPLASGVLTGKYSGKKVPEGSRFTIAQVRGARVWCWWCSGSVTSQWLQADKTLQPATHTRSSAPHLLRFLRVHPGVQYDFVAKSKLEGDDAWQIDAADALKPIAASLGCSLAQLSIAWCLANERVSTVLLGATTPAQLEENLSAVDVLPKLTPDVLAAIDAAVGERAAVRKPRVQGQVSGIRCVDAIAGEHISKAF
jgi:aryl-alcohol dehydrogenase-like predicted oxidoreductase